MKKIIEQLKDRMEVLQKTEPYAIETLTAYELVIADLEGLELLELVEGDKS